jgi:O-antigen ligase
MKRNIFAVVLLSFILAYSLLLDYKLAVALILMAIYFTIILRSQQTTIIIYFIIYLILVGYADKSSFSLSGNQSINLLGILNAMLILIFYLKLMDYLQLKKEYWNKNLLYPIFLFSLYLMLTIPFSINLTSSIRGIIRILSAFSFGLLAYFVVVNNKNAEEKIFKFITVIFTSLLIYGIIEYFTGFNIFHKRSILVPIYEGWHVVGGFNRIRTAFLGAPHYSFVILIFLPLYLYYFINRKENSHFYVLVLFLLLINLILTFTRITWIAVAIQLIFFLFLFRPKKILRFALPLGIIFMFMLKQILTRATTIDSSALGRIDAFWYGFSIFKAHPVFGSGIETYLDLSVLQFGQKTAAHGDYVKMFAETGIFGGLGYLILLFTNLVFAVRNFKENDFAKISFLTIIGFMVFSLTDNGLSYSHLFWALLGIYNGLIVRGNFGAHPLRIAQNRISSN